MKKVNIGLLGYGTVGQGVVKILREKGEELKEKLGAELVVKKVLVRDLEKEREVALDKELLTASPQEVVQDDEIDLVVEVTGDVGLSYELMKQCFAAKKHVVTANKAVVSAYFEELSELAAQNGVYFLYEASVAGGIPVLKPLKDAILLNDVSRVRGILNGTCNFILTKMTAEGADYQEVLKEAQALGYAEADPSSDVEGIDTMRKLRILATLAFGARVEESDILCMGIDKLTAYDIETLREKNYVVKLVGDAREVEGGYQAVVQPVAVHGGSYFAGVNQAMNSVALSCDMVGDLKFYGAGAGMLPTANAVLTDCIDVVTKAQGIGNPLRKGNRISKKDELSGTYYVRCSKVVPELAELADSVISKSPYAVIAKDAELMKLIDATASDPSTAIVRIEDEEY